MMKIFAVFLVLMLVVVSYPLSVVLLVEGQGADHGSLELQQSAWNQTTLSALVIPPMNDSWWDPIYLNSTLRAIGQWNDAISDFALNYSDYSYLSTVRIQPVIMNETQPNFDIYINWTEYPLSNTADEVGLTQTFTDGRNRIVNSTISLSTHTNHGDALNDGDAQNIALHELGHGLALGHSNYTGDLMYPTYTLRSGAESVSTLDGYGVATMFGWLRNPNEFYPVQGWLKQNYVVLPNYITFQYLPVTPQNARPQTLANNQVVQFLIYMFEILIHPEIAAIAAVIIVMFVVLALISRRRPRKKVKVAS